MMFSVRGNGDAGTWDKIKEILILNSFEHIEENGIFSDASLL